MKINKEETKLEKMLINRLTDNQKKLYSFEKFKYITMKTESEVYCKNCKVYFLTSAASLVYKEHGHRGCKGKRLRSHFSKGKDKFIEDAIRKHGNKFDYSLVEYINAKIQVDIICPNHGLMPQIPDTHIRSKTGCRDCGRELAVIKATYSVIDFLNKAKKIHGNTYTYENINFKDLDTIIMITCREHGDFP